MGLKDSLKRLFSTSKKVGAEKVEQSIDQVKEIAKGKTDKLEEVVDQVKENVKEFAHEKAKEIHEKAEETKGKIETKVEEAWEKFEDKAVIAVDKLEAKIRGAEPAIVESDPDKPVAADPLPEPENPERAATK